MKKAVSVVLVFLLVFTSFSIVKSTETRNSSNFDSLAEIMDRIDVSLDIAMDEESWERLYEEPYPRHRDSMRDSSVYPFEESFFHYPDFEEIRDVERYWHDNELLKHKNSNTNNGQKLGSRPSFSGVTHYVGGSGPGNYTSIQDAIDVSSDGDTVFVYDDSSPYYENVVVDKSINLYGEDRNTTVIDGGENGDVVYVSADWVNISRFIIQNCGSGSDDAGIDVRSNYSNILNTKILNNNLGIYFYGFYHDYCENNTILDNIITNNYYGIILDLTSYNNISGNTFSDNNFGVVIDNSYKTVISGNIFLNCGLIIWGLTYSYVHDNIVNGKPLIYLENESNIIIEDAGQIILSFCNNITIQNLSLCNTTIGIQLVYTNNSLISGNILSNNQYGIGIYLFSKKVDIFENIIANNSGGIAIQNSRIFNITRNTITHNEWFGIDLWTSHENMIYGNLISNNTGDGISLGFAPASIFSNYISNNNNGISLFFSGSKIISNQIYYNNYNGIRLHISDSSEISNNFCISNRVDGISLDATSTLNTIKNNTCLNNLKGIAVRDSSNNKLVNNTCNNNQQGILLNNANYTDISNNNCSHNNIGIYLFNSTNNSIIDNHCNYSSYEGIALVKSTDNSLKYNDIESNYNGLVIAESDSNNVTYNDIYDNTAIGIALQKTIGNKINYNNIHDNTDYGLAGVNCFDDARFNWWRRIIPIFFRDVLFWGWVRIFPWLFRPVDTSNNLGEGLGRKWFFPIDYGERVSHTWSEERTYTIRARAKDENWVLLGNPSLRIGGYP